MKLDEISTLYDTHDFWDTQPVPKQNDLVTEADFDAAIEAGKTVADERRDPLALPGGFYWSNIDLNDDVQAKEIYDLLVQHYVEDSDATLRFDYSVEFLRWALMPPGYREDWLFGVRGGKKNRLFGFISGIPIDLTVNGKALKMAEINFLCVHKSYREKRLAPMLIKEVTRRVHLQDVWQAMYTAGMCLPTPVSTPTYYHRSLNPKKLIECEFSSLPFNTPMSKYVKRLQLPIKTGIEGLRPMEKDDVAEVHKLLTEYLAQFQFHINMTQEDVSHMLLPRDKVVESYVVVNQKTGAITDLTSFYSLPSTVLNNIYHNRLEAAYSWYHVPGAYSMKELMYASMILAKEKGYDVMNALDIMHNEPSMFEELKFAPGSGHLYYYLYNWRVKKIIPSQIAMTLV